MRLRITVAPFSRANSLSASDPTRRSRPIPLTIRAECGNPNCSGHWLTFLKDRRRPVFEGRWCCSERCLGAVIDAAIRREARETSAAEEQVQHRHRLPLGLILLEQGAITNSQLQRALAAQRRAGCGPIGDWLAQECSLSQDHIMRALAAQWGCPVLSAEGFVPESMALALPKLFVETLELLPLKTAGHRILYLASPNRVDASAALALEHMGGLKVTSGLLDPVQWRSAKQSLCACDFVAAAWDHVADSQSMCRSMASTLAAAKPRASRLVRLHQFFWLRMWLETGAMRTHLGGLSQSPEDLIDRIYTIGAEQ